jgi:hypothetical protein
MNFLTRYEAASHKIRKEFKYTVTKPLLQKSYARLTQQGLLERNASYERVAKKKNVRSNSGVVVITVVTSPGRRKWDLFVIDNVQHLNK